MSFNAEGGRVTTGASIPDAKDAAPPQWSSMRFRHMTAPCVTLWLVTALVQLGCAAADVPEGETSNSQPQRTTTAPRDVPAAAGFRFVRPPSANVQNNGRSYIVTVRLNRPLPRSPEGVSANLTLNGLSGASRVVAFGRRSRHCYFQTIDNDRQTAPVEPGALVTIRLWVGTEPDRQLRVTVPLYAPADAPELECGKGDIEIVE